MEFVVADLEHLRTQLAAEFEALVAAGPLTCGLSGGPTALIFLGALRTAKPDWGRVSFFWVDERAVPLDDSESNAGQAKRMLLNQLTPRPRVFPMPAARPDLEAAAEEYDHVLDRETGGEPLDLVILGVGEDGHVAALFPDHPALVAQTRVVAVPDAPKAPRRRLTVSMAYLMSSTRIWIVAIGERKRALVQGAVGRAGHRSQTPFDILIRHASDVTIFTDQILHRG